MNLSADDQVFLRNLVKTSRQKVHHVPWVDRDGSPRQTSLTATEATRLNSLAHQLGVAKPELMRQAAHLPAARSPAPVADPGSV